MSSSVFLLRDLRAYAVLASLRSSAVGATIPLPGDNKVLDADESLPNLGAEVTKERDQIRTRKGPDRTKERVQNKGMTGRKGR